MATPRYTFRDGQIFKRGSDEPLRLTAGCCSTDRFGSAEIAMEWLIFSGEAEEYATLADEDGNVFDLAKTKYWTKDKSEPCFVVVPEFKVDWKPDDDPDTSWIEEQIKDSIESDWVRCRHCDKVFRVGKMYPTGPEFHENCDGDNPAEIGEIEAESYGDCPTCGRDLEDVVALRLSKRNEPVARESETEPDSREFYDTEKDAIRAGWDLWAEHLEFYGCIVTATWNGLEGCDSLWGICVDGRLDNREYMESNEKDLKEQALDSLISRLKARAELKLP